MRWASSLEDDGRTLTQYEFLLPEEQIVVGNTRLGSAVRKTMRHMKEQTAGEAGRAAPTAERSEGEAMREEAGKRFLSSCADEKSQDISYGCLFCMTGKEQSVADQIQAECPNVRATTMRQLKHRTCKKDKTREKAILLPSYVFFEAPSSMEPSVEFPTQNVIRILFLDKGVWQLQGEDERFVKWLFQYDGLLGFSQAYKEGDQIRIVSGPLKDMEGKIRRVDKRGMSGQVILSFYGKNIPVWLGFEMIMNYNAT